MWFKFILVNDIDTGHITTILPAICMGEKLGLSHIQENIGQGS